jgi:large subunit ribosomal protein L2
MCIKYRKPEKILTYFLHRKNGRNCTGKITCRHKGSGHKKLYRNVDFSRREKKNNLYKVLNIQYDPYRTSKIALIENSSHLKKYIIAPLGLKENTTISLGTTDKIETGNCVVLNLIPIGQEVHCIEFTPNSKGKIARSAGTFARVISKTQKMVILKLPTGELRAFNPNCRAIIGRVSDNPNKIKPLKKAGSSRHRGIRPTVRGSAMNAVDHPHGGGEGRSPIGLKHPKTPWGKPALGVKTRDKKKRSSIYIVKRVK